MAKDELRWIASGKQFQVCGPAMAKVQSPIVECHVIVGTLRSADDAERRQCCVMFLFEICWNGWALTVVYRPFNLTLKSQKQNNVRRRCI